ncbi:Basic form of pathogenesis-related protein 1 [Glycine soja]
MHMRRFLVDRASIENVNVVQQEAELEPPPNVVNEFNPNEIVRDPVDVVKARLGTMRESGWNNFFADVQGFCVAKSILVPNMDDEIPVRGRSRAEGRTITNLHHYRPEIFYVAIDKICVEMDHRFSEGSNIILDCFSCLDPKNSFSKFDVDKLARLADIYHADFSDDDRGTIRDQLETYVLQVRRNASFSTCEDVQSLAMKMVQTEKHLVFPLVYKLIELALILPVSTASVERAFSAMKIIKSKLRNKINDVWFNDLMVCYTEREIFKSLDDIDIIRTFTAKKSRKGHLPLIVPSLAWDDTVAAYAESYANQRKGDCQLIHSGGEYGENIAMSTGELSGTDAVKMWVDEKSNYDYDSNSCVGGECLHYTQVVWANSVRLGCAKVTCDNGGTFITCNYDPPGNFVGERPYKL